MARAARLQGTVILQVIIQPDGTVSDIKTLRAQSMGLTEAAIAAVRQWRYQPAKLDGAAVLLLSDDPPSLGSFARATAAWGALPLEASREELIAAVHALARTAAVSSGRSID